MTQMFNELVTTPLVFVIGALLLAMGLTTFPSHAYSVTYLQSEEHGKWSVDGSIGAGGLFLDMEPIFATMESVGLSVHIYKNLYLRTAFCYSHLIGNIPYFQRWRGRSWYFFYDIGYQYRIFRFPNGFFDGAVLFSFSKAHEDDGPKVSLMDYPIAIGGGIKTHWYLDVILFKNLHLIQQFEIRYAVHLFDKIHHTLFPNATTGISIHF